MILFSFTKCDLTVLVSVSPLFDVFSFFTMLLTNIFFQVETSIPTPKRETEKPFLMPVEDTFSISGRGTVASGRIEQGCLKTGDDLEIVGLRPTQKTICTGKHKIRKQRMMFDVCCDVIVTD